MTLSGRIAAALQPLVGLKLSIARRGADMRGFHFGAIRRVEKGTVADYALHIQCAWRIDGPDGIITGSADLWHPAEIGPDMNWDAWDYEKDGNLQDRQLGALLGGFDESTRSIVNETNELVVQSVEADEHGGFKLALSGGYALEIFPAGSRGEDWRLLGPVLGEHHFVVAGGKIEENHEAA